MASSLKQVKLEKECEVRIEVSDSTPLRLRLLNGTAEIFGTEVPPQIWLNFPPRLKFALFSWHGATIEMDGGPYLSEYVADETPMISYVNVHAILDARRSQAKASSSTDSHSSQRSVNFVCKINYKCEIKSHELSAAAAAVLKLSRDPIYVKWRIRLFHTVMASWVRLQLLGYFMRQLVVGPRVIVVGPTDSGKSSLSRMLLSWAAKQGWKPTFVDLDIGQGSITVPGCVAATPIELPIDPVEGIPLEMPLVYFYGHTTPRANVDLYKIVVKELGQTLERQFSGNTESRAAGMVINTMGWIDGVGYTLLLHAIDTFNADVVLVLGQEKLCSMLRDMLKSKPKVDVEYFYGMANDLSPHSNIASFSDLSIFRVGGGPQAPRSALPIGAEPAADPTRLVPVNITQDLLHLVLAVSFAKDPAEIISSNVAGFIYITDVDVQRRKITYLAPSVGELPSKILILGTLAWLEN
ncbi:hypothetical protein KSS87_023889 [Heliosperma pusillum]|nr:hypothetical protein KSS87_023889 [Heliosperma pusillum]